MESSRKADTISGDLKQDIEAKIEAALADLKEEIGAKKFKRRVKKASKILSKNLKNKKALKIKKIKVKSK